MKHNLSIFHQEYDYRFVNYPTQAIRLSINKTRARNRSTMPSLGYQMCAARLSSPRRLILACELKNTSVNKKDTQ